MADEGSDERLNDPMFMAQPVSLPERRPWWLVTRGLVSAIVLTGLWLVMLVVRVYALVTDTHKGVFDIGYLTLCAFGVAISAPSLIHFVRLRRGEPRIDR